VQTKKILIASPLLILASLQANAQADRTLCYQQEQQLLDDVGVLRDNIMGAPITADQLLLTEAYVEAERLNRSGVKYLEKKKTLAMGPAGTNAITDLARVVTVPGNENCDGLEFLKPLEPEEAAQLRQENGMSPEETAEFMDLYAQGLLGLGTVMEREMPGGMDEDSIEMAVLDGGCGLVADSMMTGGYSDTVAVGRPLGATPDSINPLSPGTMFSPLVFLSGPACMARKMSEHALYYSPESDDDSAQQRGDDLNRAVARVDYAGVDSLADGPAHHVSATGLNATHTSDDGTRMTINEMHAWISTDKLLRKKMRFTGVMEQQGEQRDFFLETEMSDFRRIGDSLLFVPHRETMRMGGVLGEKERAEMAEAQKQLADFEKQLAAMPANQRAMMENMMGGQLAQMRGMVNNGTVEFDFVISDVRINPTFGAAASLLPEDDTNNLVRIIQGHLVTLGYDPGNTDGELSKATVVAITKFEAANNMPVTGKATPQLAGILAAAVDAR